MLAEQSGDHGGKLLLEVELPRLLMFTVHLGEVERVLQIIAAVYLHEVKEGITWARATTLRAQESSCCYQNHLQEHDSSSTLVTKPRKQTQEEKVWVQEGKDRVKAKASKETSHGHEWVEGMEVQEAQEWRLKAEGSCSALCMAAEEGRLGAREYRIVMI